MNDKELKAWLLSRHNEDEPHLDCVVDQDERKWSVYVHIVPKALSGYDYDKYYVGITCQKPETRWGHGNNYLKQPAFGSAIKKYGWDNIEHHIITSGLTENEAKNFEINLIEQLNSMSKYGYNMTKGGDGMLGHHQTEEIKKIISQTTKNRWKNPEYRENQLERMKNIHDNINYDLVRGGLHYHAQKVVLLNTRQVFDSIIEAANEVEINHSIIVDCCQEKTNGTFSEKYQEVLVWKYYNDYKNMSEEDIKFELISKIKHYNQPRLAKPYVLLNTGEIFYYYIDLHEKYPKIKSDKLNYACKGLRNSCGKLDDGTPLVWSYYNDYIKMTPQEIQQHLDLANSHRPKYIIDLETNIVYRSATLCAKYVNIYDSLISKSAKHQFGKKSNTPYKDRFQFLTEYLEQNNIDNNEARKRLIFIE